MGEPSGRRFRRHEKRITALLDDPDLTGDLLLIAIALARHFDLRDGGDKEDVAGAALGMFPGDTQAVYVRVFKALRSDIRRYEVPPGGGPDGRNTCDAAMVTRDRCGKPASCGTIVWDPDTGEGRHLSACGQRDHRDWWKEQSKAAKAARQAAGDDFPRPPANTGGVLARHFPEIDWPNMWAHLDDDWEPHPEPVEPVQMPFEGLRLITGDGAGAGGPRAGLRVIE